MIRIVFYISMLILTVVLPGACAPGERDYSRWRNLPSEGWMYADTVSLVPVDTALVGNDSVVTGGGLNVALRHSNDYPFSNLWLELTYIDANGGAVRDTVNVRLADVFGRWLGIGFGAEYQQEVLVSRVNIDITKPVRLRHIMRVDTLRGIDQVGVSVIR